MFKNKKLLLLFLLVLIGLGSYFFYQYRKLHYVYKIKDLPESEYNVLHFHPDSILAIALSSGQSTISFKRSNRLQAWDANSKVNAKIHNMLNQIASLSVERSEELKSGIFVLKFKADDNTDWQMITNSTHFYWQEGPLKGRGGLLPVRLRSIFSGSEFLFANETFVLCKNRPIDFISKGKTIKMLNNRWVLNTEIMPDQNFMELWIGKNCTKNFSNIISKSKLNEVEHEQFLLSLDKNNLMYFKIADKTQNEVVLTWNLNNEINLYHVNSKILLEVYDDQFAKELKLMLDALLK